MTRIGLLYVDNFEQNRSRHVGSLGLAYVAAYLQEHLSQAEVKIGIFPQDLDSFHPDLVGVSAYSETLPTAVEYATQIKQKHDIPVVLGGPHLASNPADLPAPFDLGVAGEGETLFLQIAQWVHQNTDLTPALFQGHLGLTYRHEGQAIAQGRCPPIDDMDSLPHPNRPLMYAAMQAHFQDFKPVIHLHTARGCPYRCTFCSAPLVNPKWRFHSPEWVIQELEILARQFPHCRELTLSDDLFTLKKSRLEALVKAIKSAGFDKRFFFFCSSRSNTLTPEMCRLLREMNVLMVSFGFESASDTLIRDLKGVGTHRCDYERVLHLCQNHGIYAHGNFIIGSQAETRYDLSQTYDFVLTNQDRFASVYFSHMTPFPGTKVWDDAEAADLIPQDVDYRVLNLEYKRGESVFLNQHYSEDFYQGAFQAFKQLTAHTNDRYYLEQKLLKDIIWKERHTIPEALQEACEHLNIQNLAVVTHEYHPLKGAARVYPPDQPLDPGHDAIYLPHTLETLAHPEQIIQQWPRVPLFVLHYHLANFYELTLLLQNKWEEGVYGVRQRRMQRYWSLKTLGQTFQELGWQLSSHFKFKYDESLCSPGVIGPLQQMFQAPDLDVFAYMSLLEPIVPGRE